MQATRKNVKKYLIISCSLVFIFSGGIALFRTLPSNAYDRCDYYTAELKGGVKEYEGRKFKIDLCGTGGHNTRFRFEDDEIRLRVFNEKGNLLALRHFKVNWEENRQTRGIRYYPDRLTYFDESLQNDFEKTLSMPPSTLDWVRAKIPFLD